MPCRETETSLSMAECSIHVPEIPAGRAIQQIYQRHGKKHNILTVRTIPSTKGSKDQGAKAKGHHTYLENMLLSSLAFQAGTERSPIKQDYNYNNCRLFSLCALFQIESYKKASSN
ncbi:hypothetical protein EGW08_017932 [Elysia chlorotica]|uniref:Uncharacterized protein n=1 Tax=Elysia chlorotica TaxID=188477 RepID=A0A433SYB5_ELYCH|nr:hypothetical protein EGW08_017932 [Elysia chlorotica]